MAMLRPKLLRHRCDAVLVSIVILLACSQIVVFLHVDDWLTLAVAPAVFMLFQATAN